MNDPAIDKSELQRELQKRLKRAARRVSELETKQREALNWPHHHHEGLLLQANLYLWKKGMLSLEVSDWKNGGTPRAIHLTPPLSGHEEVALRFKKSRKSRLAIPHVSRLLAKAVEEQEEVEVLLAKLEALETAEQWGEWQAVYCRLFPIGLEKKTLPKIKPLTLPYREYFSASGHKIWVGKKAKDNETLTFHLAHGNDVWLHAHGFPGSHVIIRARKGVEVDPETLQDALQLALVHSQAKRQGRAEVLVTQQKYVSRYGKGPKNCGKVQVSKHKLYPVDLDLRHFERIKRRALPQNNLSHKID